MHIFFVLPLLIILFVVIAVLITAGNIVRSIFSVFSFRRKNRTRESTRNNNDRTYTSYEKRAKVFGPNEGEYVDFEEVKEKQ